MTSIVPIPVIQKIVSDVSNITVEEMLRPTTMLAAKKGEIVMPRQVSMSLSKKYTPYSLKTIGEMHGGRDHATVLHAVKVVNDGIETRHPVFVSIYAESAKKVNGWLNIARMRQVYKKQTGEQIPIKLKLQILKSCILNEVELDQRERIFNTVYTEKDKRFKYDRYSATALPGRM